MEIADRKAIEIKIKLANLESESEKWRERTRSIFPQHASQIEEAWKILNVLRKKAEANHAAWEPHRTSMMVLATHRLWEFFRSKFSQRLVDEYRTYLAWADQLAWNCYKPVREISVKAPPLVYLNGGFSPFVTRRGSPYFAEIVASESFTDEEAIAAQKKLPFPVIGVPYYQVRYYAEMPSIAHEVGHAVEDDLDLNKELNQVFTNTLKPEHARLNFWMGWRRELFADVWGCLGTGPAFASALADFKFGQVNESPIPVSGTKYPPPWLRIAFIKAILESKPLNFDVGAILQPYQEVFKEADGAKAFLDDVNSLATAVLTHRFARGWKLPTLLTFSAQQQERAEKAAQDVLSTPPKAITNELDIRVVTAAYRLAYDADAKRVSEPTTMERFTTAFNASLTTEARAGEFPDVSLQNESRANALFDILSGS